MRRRLAAVAAIGVWTGCAAGSSIDTPEPAVAPSPPHTPIEQAKPLVEIDREALGPRYAIALDQHDPAVGADPAAVTIVAFIDYGHAGGTIMAGDLQQLVDLDDDRLRVVIKPFTHALGSDQRYAARAVLAASRQGFGWPMHARIVGRTEGLARREALEIAAAIGIPDLRAFGQDVDNQDPLDRNVELANRFGVNIRTLVFINGAAYPQLEGVAAMRSAVETEAAVADGLLGAGVLPGDLYATIIDGATQQRAAIIDYEPPFDGEPIAEESLASGVGIEVFRRGDGDVIVDGDIVSFEFNGYGTVNGRKVMGSRDEPAKLVLMPVPSDPIAQAFVDSIRGQHVGAQLRVTIPESLIPPEKQRDGVGGVVLTIEILASEPRPALAELAAFTGKPKTTETRAGGLEISDYASGTGRRARAGDRVTVHYIGQLEDGTEFDSSHNRAKGLEAIVGGEGVIKGFSEALEGARVGMLRKVVIPPELGWGDRETGKIPANATLIFYLEIMEVAEAEAKSEVD